MSVDVLFIAFASAAAGAAGTAFAGVPRHLLEWFGERKRRERQFRAHIERIPAIEAQLLTNGGTSLRDEVTRTKNNSAAALEQSQATRNALEAATTSIEDVDRRLEVHIEEFRSFRGAVEHSAEAAVEANQEAVRAIGELGERVSHIEGRLSA